MTVVSTLAPPLEVFGVDALRDTMTTFRETLAAHAERINRLNVYPVPDGDTGTNMARTLDAVVAEMEAAPGDLVPTCDAISHGSLMGARGNSGVILSQIMRGIAVDPQGHRRGDRGDRRRGVAGRHGGRLQGRAHARRGHDPHRGARQRRRCS